MAQISKEYASALFAVATENGIEKDVLEALKDVSEAFETNEGYIDFLASAAIPKKERTAALQQVLDGKVPDCVVVFVKMLCERGHIRELGACAGEYAVLYRASRNISTAKVTSAVALTQEQRDALKSNLEKQVGHTVELDCAVDASLVGGIKIMVDGKVIDGSVRHRLREVKEVIDK